MSADVLLGTPNYISPEQAKGQSELDGRTDIYSLGVVLYELIVGRIPFTGDTPYAIIHNHIYTPLPLPRQINPEVPAEVEDVLLKALAKSPDERYSTVAEMIKDLREAIKQSNLTNLNPERGKAATAVLAKTRGQQPTPPPSTVAFSPVASVATVAKVKRGGKRLRLIGGIVAVLIIVVAVGILLGRSPTSADDNPSTLEIMPVAVLSVEEAQAKQAENPDDPVAYLALGRAYWSEGNAKAGYDAVREGMEFADDTRSYLLTAASLANDTKQGYGAIGYALLALTLAEDDPATVSVLRNVVGERLYTAALQGGNRVELAKFQQTLLAITQDEAQVQEITSSGLFKLFMARSLITNGNTLLAQQALNSLSSVESEWPEAYLVRGELLLARGNRRLALAELNTARDAADSPQWVQKRAEELLNAIRNE
jgi:tetratricopeptide (TPR) repeat protein